MVASGAAFAEVYFLWLLRETPKAAFGYGLRLKSSRDVLAGVWIEYMNLQIRCHLMTKGKVIVSG